MNEHDRIEYANLMLTHEFEKFARALFFTDEQWTVHFLSRPEVDPTGAHKPYGLTAPQWVNEQLLIGFCVPRLVRPLAGHDDDEFQSWMEFWVIHLGLHVIVNKDALDAGETLTLDEMERRVEARFADEARGTFWLAEMIRGSIGTP